MKWSTFFARLGTFTLVFLSGQWIPTQSDARIRYLPLDAPARVEFSSLAWLGDELLLLPEKPDRFRPQGPIGALFTLPRQAILDALDGRRSEPLKPKALPLVGSRIYATTESWGVTAAGFEAMAVSGQTLYLLIEGQSPQAQKDMHTYLVSGAIAPDHSQIVLDLSAPVELPQQAHFYNLSYESLTVVGDRLVAFYEVNTPALNPSPRAVVIDPATRAVTTLPMSAVDARITDVTPPDERGEFWALSCCLLGEALIATDLDVIAQEYGLTVLTAPVHETPQFVPLRYTDQGIVRADQPAVSATWTDGTVFENWEGIARLDDRGFLIVTDQYPDTRLGFMPVAPGALKP